jgi:hypothetical protein
VGVRLWNGDTGQDVVVLEMALFQRAWRSPVGDLPVEQPGRAGPAGTGRTAKGEPDAGRLGRIEDSLARLD